MMKLELNRLEVCDLAMACTALVIDMQDEIKDPETTEGRREVLYSSITKWQSLHDKVIEQLNFYDDEQLLDKLYDTIYRNSLDRDATRKRILAIINEEEDA